MNIPLYNQELFDFFERSNEPNIFPFKEKGDISLQQLEPSEKNTEESIKAINGLINALVTLRMNYIIPSQIHFSYVIRKKGVWGLRHVICDRDPEQQKKDEDSYDPQQYKYHASAQNELMWNIGKIWLRFFTSHLIRIKYDRQEKIMKIIADNVPDKHIMELIMKCLNRYQGDRIGFEQFLQDDFFIPSTPEEINPTSTYIFSALSYFKAMSLVDLETSTGKLTTLDSQNPFVKEIRYRCFYEYLQVDLYFQHVKGQIKELYYQKADLQQRETCYFSLYIIELQNYFNMIRLNKERIEIGERFDELEHRLYLSRFSKRMVKIREDLDKMAKKLRASSSLSRNAMVFCRNIDDLVSRDVYNKFKKVLVEYAQYLNFDLKKDKNDITALKLLVKIYIIRTSSYVFSEMRSEVFQPFLRIDRTFNLKKVLARINESIDMEALRQLLNNIKKFYFSP